MSTARRHAFVDGLVTGALASLVLAAGGLYTLHAVGRLSLDGGDWSLAGPALGWLQANLGLSLPVFGLVLLLYLLSLSSLHRRVAASRPLDEVLQAEHLTDVWTSLFFGVGVVWTAIGMRGALVHALGDTAAVASDGAFAVLERMVDGGILVALSTTIFGGVGGYLMRIVKAVTVGAPLKRYLEHESRASGERIEATLVAIEARVARLDDFAAALAGTRREEAA